MLTHLFIRNYFWAALLMIVSFRHVDPPDKKEIFSIFIFIPGC